MRATRLAAAIAAAAALSLSTLTPVAFATSPSPEPEKCGNECSEPKPGKGLITASTECSDTGVLVTLKNKFKKDLELTLKGTVNDAPYEKSVTVGGNATATETLELANGKSYELVATLQVGRKSIEVATLEGTRQCADVGTPEVVCKHHKVLVPLTAGDEPTRFVVGDKTVLVGAGQTETVKVPISPDNNGTVEILVKGPFGDRTLTVDVSSCKKPEPECGTADASYDCKSKAIHVKLDNPLDHPIKVNATLLVDGKVVKESKNSHIKPGTLAFDVPLAECNDWKLEFTGGIKKTLTGNCECPDEVTPTPTPTPTATGGTTTPTQPPSTPDDGQVIPGDNTTPPSGDTPMQPVGNDDGSLAETGGGSAVPIAVTGGALLAAGAGALVITRRRRATRG